jgi:putative ATP-binding cassette transporter
MALGATCNCGSKPCGSLPLQNAPSRDLMEFVAVLQAQSHKASPKDYKLDGLALKRIWQMARPFWCRRAAWPYWILMGSLILAAPGFSVLMAYLSKVTADMTNEMVAYQAAAFWPTMWFFLALAFIHKVGSSTVYMLASRLDLHWRRWLTTRLIDHYLAKRTYYDIALKGDMDNPDQRIQDCVGKFTSQISSFPRTVLGQLTGVVAGAVVLASMDMRLIGVVALYAVVHTVASLILYSPTVKQQIELTIAEADFRYSILHVRDNAETVAFYRGERSERDQILNRLKVALKKNLVVIMYKFRIDLVTNDFLYMIWTAIPYLFLVPIYFSGHMKFGSIAQGTFAANQLLTALDVLQRNLPTLAAAVPDAVRLAEIEERFETMEAERSDPSISRVSLQHGSDIRLEHVSLQTPAGEQGLVRDLSLELRPGDNLVVVGQTGVGKSSLLRAMAGLWSRGSGTIVMPPTDRCLFLPQRPYMVLGDLRAQLCYPNPCTSSDNDLAAVLERVMLPDLIQKHGGWAAERDWSKVLSLGEQQRIAFARILVSRPDYVFLDEATSALDFATELRLYSLLAQCHCTYVSVGHRASILEHHTQALRLLPGGGWELETIAEAIAHQEAVIVIDNRSDPAMV